MGRTIAMSVHVELSSLYGIDLLGNSQNILLLSGWFLLNARVIPFDVFLETQIMRSAMAGTVGNTVESHLYCSMSAGSNNFSCASNIAPFRVLALYSLYYPKRFNILVLRHVYIILKES